MRKLKNGAVRKLREQKLWSQEDLARRAGISTRTLQRVEAGACAKMDTLAFLAEALEVPPTDLLEHTPSAEVGDTSKNKEGRHKAGPTAIPVVLHRITDGKALLDAVHNSMALLPETRGIADRVDAEMIGAIFDDLRDYMDVSSELSFTHQLRYGLELTERITDLQTRGWWILVGKKRHALRFPTGNPEPIPWVTSVILVARADDSVVVHREDGEPVALVTLPEQFNFA